MKKFAFSLATLLQFRRQQEEIAHKNLLETHLVLRKFIILLEEMALELDDVLKQTAHAQVEKKHPASIALFYHYMDHLKNKITRQKNLVAEAEASVERQRKEVVKAMQKRKIIENLQDKKYSEWETLNFNLERASLDELATMRYSKSKSQLQ
jgi:flagellar export protein FliJ